MLFHLSVLMFVHLRDAEHHSLPHKIDSARRLLHIQNLFAHQLLIDQATHGGRTVCDTRVRVPCMLKQRGHRVKSEGRTRRKKLTQKENNTTRERKMSECEGDSLQVSPPSLTLSLPLFADVLTGSQCEDPVLFILFFSFLLILSLLVLSVPAAAEFE